MRKFLLLINFTFFILPFTFFTPEESFGQAPLVKQWDKTLGGFQNEWLFGLEQTTDGGFILAGHTNSDSTGVITEANRDTSLATDDYWMIKTDASGNKLWDKRFGGTLYDYMLDMQQTSDGGYILGGVSFSGADGDKSDPSHDTTSQWWDRGDFWIVKTDSLGNKLWDKSFGGCDAEQLTSLRQTPDGGYILGGWTDSDSCGDVSHYTKGYADAWVVKTDSLGNMQWNKRYGGNYSDGISSLRIIPGGGYILGCVTESDSTGDVSQPTRGAYDFWFLKIDDNGVKQWDKRFGGIYDERPNSLKLTHDGGYIMAGVSNSDSSGDKTEDCYGIIDGWVVKIDSAGNKQWDKTFGGSEQETPDYSYIIQTSDKGYLYSNHSESDSSGNKTEDNLPGYGHTWAVKTDSLGNIEWDKTIFVYGASGGALALQANDGCYLFGNFNSGGIGAYKTEPNWDPLGSSYDFWMVKFCDSTLTTSIAQLPDYPTFSIYPNPANDYVIVNYHFKAGDEIRLTDILGKLLFTTTITTPTSDFRLPTSHFTPGIYFLKAGNAVRKFVKE